MENGKQSTRETIKDIVATAFIWLLALFIVYMLYLKIKLLH